jgi:hypothetical protein
LGEPVYLSEDEARNSAETNAGQVERPWNVWKSKLPKSNASKENQHA